jgi:rhodanese-related sulfurtransferase
MANKRKSNKKSAQGALGNRNLIVIAAAVAVVLIGVIAVLVLGSQAPAAESAVANLPAEINVDQAYDYYQQGYFLLDVREPSEWDEIHVPEATLIPLGELESRVNELPRDQEIIVMCRSGNRSQVGRDILKDAGFESVTSIAGGIQEWRASGYPTVP